MGTCASKTLFKKQIAGYIWPADGILPIPGLENNFQFWHLLIWGFDLVIYYFPALIFFPQWNTLFSQ